MANTEPNKAAPPPAPDEPALAPGRSCAGCTMCCKLMGIAALAKPAQQWCAHCTVGTGCRIYATRPDECRTFFCSWLVDPGVGEHWAPKRSRMVLTFKAEEKQIIVHVDGGRAGAWRDEPYRADIARWTEMTAATGGQLLVRLPRETIALMPGREKSLGPLRADQIILTMKRESPAGIEWDAMVVEPNDPLLKQMGR